MVERVEPVRDVTSLEPALLEPESLEPESLEPESLEPESLEPASLEPAALEPASLEPPLLETPRLRITLPQPEDVDAMVDFLERNQAHLRPWSPPEPPGMRTREGALRRIERMHAELRARSSARFWIRWRAQPSGPFIGALSLSSIVLGPFRACYLGYQLDASLVGQGIMHEALGAAIRYAFDELRLHRIMANYVPTNERSGRVLRRLGFVVEGYARDYLFIGGQFRDHVLTALTNQHLPDAERLCTPSA
jgi:[ribosomal protein S5]-alanine N-acetyltransferase